jgi:hypothetical protein
MIQMVGEYAPVKEGNHSKPDELVSQQSGFEWFPLYMSRCHKRFLDTLVSVLTDNIDIIGTAGQYR